MKSFGELLRTHRQSCRDPIRGGFLTQERLGELLGHELGDAGYSGAAVSDWERNKSKINEDSRLVLINLLVVLQKYGDLHTPSEAEELLRSGNYRALNQKEFGRLFPDLAQRQETAANTHSPGIIKPEPVPQAQPTTPSEPRAISQSPQRRKQHILLEKVQNFWVKGVLEQSVRDAMLIDISHRYFDEAVDHPWMNIIRTAVDDLSRSSNQQIVDVFKNNDCSLLILGEPGAGKTTTLLMLARDLIALAENDPSAPIPTLLSLSSWAEKQAPLAEWVVEELVAKYRIPREIGGQWLQGDDLLLLLDGYDEVPDRFRADCANAINQFRDTNGLTGIAICSRIEAYNTTSATLKLGGAIMLQPLTETQIEAYLETADPNTKGLRAAVEQDSSLREMAQSPLMLNIMRIAFSVEGAAYTEETPEYRPDTDGSNIPSHQHLFAIYVQRMLQQRHVDPTFSPAQIKHWLAWLAQKMTVHNQTVFFVEQLQPSWLSTRRQRWFYMILSRLLMGLYGGIFMWLLLGILRRTIPNIPNELSDQVARLLGMARGPAEFVAFIVGNLFLASLVANIHGFHFERRYGHEELGRIEARQGWPQVFTVGILVFLITTMILRLFGQPILALAWGIAEAALYMVISRYINGRNYRNEIRTVEALGWSWSSAVKGIGFGMLLAMIAMGIENWFNDPGGGYEIVLMFGFGGLILGGLRGHRVESKSEPNQGIRLSIRNAMLAALISSFSIGLLAWVLWDGTIAIFTTLVVILLVLLLYGGSNVANHYLVRFFLWRDKHIPWQYVSFLDYASRMTFLTRVGNGYIFMHRLLGEWLASQTSSSPKT